MKQAAVMTDQERAYEEFRRARRIANEARADELEEGIERVRAMG
jgi:hypothetical protein